MAWLTEVSDEAAAKLRKMVASTTRVTSGGCLEWLGEVKADNYSTYGRVRFRDGGRTLLTGAHRASYLAHNGTIGAGLTVHHECYNTLCVNPSHLSLLTMGDNVRHGNPGRKPSVEKFALGSRTQCRNGHDWNASNVSFDKKGYARCKRCVCESVQRHYARNGRPST